MWWAIPLATTAMGMIRQNRQAEDQRKYNLAQAEMTRYSPWTGQKGVLDNRDTGSPLEAGVTGGITGLGITQSLGGDLGSFGGAQQAASQGAGQNLGVSLGAQEIGQNLGNKFNYGLPNIYQQKPKLQNMGLSLANNPWGY